LTISKEQEAQILRYHHVEKWRVGTIACQLGLHHDTVERVLSQAGMPKVERAARPSMIDPFLGFVSETLSRFPTLTAARLYEMVRERGYLGGPDHFRHQIACYRPRPQPEAFLRLKTLPGEQGQVDWGHFGKLTIGRAEHALMAFVMVLSYSRRLFLRFFLGARMANFLRGHEAAFSAWKGLPRVLLYDNLKSAVLERRGDAIRFHPTLLELAAHYRFEPRPVAVARGNEKGRVERAIRYVRDHFWAARPWRDLDDLNAQAEAWCNGWAMDRPCPEERSLSVRQAFEQESLLPLPDNPYPTDERVEVHIGKTPYARFERNDYSVPHTHVQRILTVSASPTEVRILDGGEEIARHRRSYDKGQQIEQPQHIEALVQLKRQARRHRGQDRLAQAAPASRALLIQAAERGDNLGTITAALLRLLEDYGAAPLQAAITESLAQGVAHPNGVRIALQRQREAAHRPPPVGIRITDERAKAVVVQPHDLQAYDRLQAGETDENRQEAPNDK
jgi:transposase